MDDLLPQPKLFWEKVDASSDCWEWTASRTTTGYGQVGIQRQGIRKTFKAHRVAYELVRGPIPEGLEIDHLCENSICVNPWHLESVEHVENIRRASRHNTNKTQCPQGHGYSDANTYRKPNGSRICRICHRIQERVRMSARG